MAADRLDRRRTGRKVGNVDEADKWNVLAKLVGTLERLADAEEERNRLIVKDQMERREAWEREQATMSERWEQIGQIERRPEMNVEIRRLGDGPDNPAGDWRPSYDGEKLEPGVYEARHRIPGGNAGPSTIFRVADPKA